MLNHLSIKNYILINELEINFKPGFSAITGETGAGKSILIGALSLILGNRADTSVLLDKERKCIVEGFFNIDDQGLEPFFEEYDLDHDDQLVLRREINKSGKSRAFINDTPVNLPLMKELGERLVDVHSQHESLMLSKSGFQLAVVDNYAANQKLVSLYNSGFEKYSNLISSLEELKARETDIRAEEDYLRYQFEEIDKADLRVDELQGLEEEQEVISHAEEIKGNLYKAVQMLHLSDDNLIDRLSGLLTITGKVSAYHKEIRKLHERLESSNIEIKDIGNALAQLEEEISFDPDRHEEITNRLDLIYSLLQKHKVKEISELIGLRDEFQEKISMIDNIDDDIRKLEKEVASANQMLAGHSNELSKRRNEVIPALEKEISGLLMHLGMEKAVVKVRIENMESYTASGKDSIEFLFSANPGSAPAPVSKIASGGELSRLMLALKSLITRKNLLPTIILDEIDMGVSGEIAAKVGNLLSSMAENMQLIAITHLPQIAGKAREHFKVFKNFTDDRTDSGVVRLSDSERIEEIAAMLSNENVSQAAKETAKELLDYHIDKKS